MAALDTEEASNSLFGNIKKHAKLAPEIQDNPNKIAIPEKESTLTSDEISLAKWQNFDKVTVLLTSEQKDGLDKIAKSIMKYRVKSGTSTADRERITANTIVRALIDNLLENKSRLTQEIINNEKEVHKWLSQIFAQ